MMTLKYSLLCLCLSFYFIVAGQNLIPNPGFELVNLCHKYQEGCFPKGWKSTSLKLTQYIGADGNGNKQMSLVYYDAARTFDRRFIQTQLLHPIEAGKKYKLSFDFGKEFPRAQTLGFLFANSYFFDKQNKGIESHGNIIEIPLQNDPENKWTTYSATFTAEENATHLIIGNFQSDSTSAFFPIHKKKAKQLAKSYWPQNRILIQLDNVLLEPVGFNFEFDESSALQEIYHDNIRHSFRVKEMPESKLKFEESIPIITEPEEESVEIIDQPLQPGLNTLQGVAFEFGTTTLTPESSPNLLPIVEYLKTMPETQLLILGHTDNIGSELGNLTLSKERAEVIYNYLIAQGIQQSRLAFRGLGATRPVAANDTESGRQKNRRVEVEIKN